jgi:WD40 repeat protein
LLAVGGAQNVAVFDLSSGRGLYLLPGGGNGALQFSADGQRLAVRGSGGWRLWSADTGQPLVSLTADAHGVPLALSPSLAQALRSDGRHVSLVNLADASVVARTASPGVTQAVFSPDGGHVAWVQGDGRALRWQLQGGVPQMLEPALAAATAAPDETPPALAFSTDGALLAAAGPDQVLRLWDGQGRPQGRLSASGQSLHSLAFAADGSALALALTEGTAWLLDTTSGQLQPLRSPAGARPASSSEPGRLVELSPDGRTLASAAGGQLRLFNRASGQALVTLGAAQARDLRFSRDGAWLFVLEAQQLQVWDVALRYKLQTLPLASDLQHNTMLAFDAGGQALLLWADGGQPRRAQLETRAITNQGLGPAQRQAVPGLPAVLPADRRWSAATAPDGLALALDNGEGDTLVLERASGRELLRLRAAVPAGSTLQFSADGRVLMAWGAPGGQHQVLRWALPGGQVLPPLNGHRARIRGLTSSADGRWLASLAEDRSLRLWRASDGQLRATLQLLGAPGWVAVDDSGGFEAASPDAEGALLLRSGPGLAEAGPLGAASAQFRRPGVLQRAFVTAP